MKKTRILSWELEAIDDGIDYEGNDAIRFILTIGVAPDSDSEEQQDIENLIGDLLTKELD